MGIPEPQKVARYGVGFKLNDLQISETPEVKGYY